jgi:hypothetical protein
VAHILVDVAAGIIPEVAPVDVTIGVELPLGGLAEERIPKDVFRIHIRIDGPGPLRFSMRRVAIHVHVDGGDLAHVAGREETLRIGHLAGGNALVTDLDGELGRFQIGGAHAFGMVHREGHGLFLVDVLAGFDGMHEVFAMQVLRSGDDNGVDSFIVEQAAMVEIGGGVGDQAFGVFQAFGVDIGEGYEIEIGARESPVDQFDAARAGPDYPDANAVVCAEHTFGGSEGGGEAGRHGSDEFAAGIDHSGLILNVNISNQPRLFGYSVIRFACLVYARHMRIFRTAGFLAGGCMLGVCYAHWVRDAFATVPVDRLLANLERYVQENPKDSRGYFALGRLHGLAYARDIQSVTVWNERGEGKMGPSKKPMVVDSVAGPHDPKKKDSEEGRKHLLEAVRDLKRATELNGSDPLVFLGLGWVLEEGSAMAYDFGLPPGYESSAKTPTKVELRYQDRVVAYDTDELFRQWHGGLFYHVILPALQENVDGIVSRLVEMRNDDSVWIRAEVARLLTFYWQKRALEAYRVAYRTTVVKDLRAGSSGPGADSLISLEAGEGITRILQRWYPPDDVSAEVREVRAAITKLNEKPVAMTPVIFSMDPEFGLTDLLAAGKAVPFDLDGTARERKWSWVKPGVCLLAWDPESTGRIASGRQLFGNVTWWMFWRDGYAALEALDNDGDGWLSGAELDGVVVWRDVNGNGVSDPGEVVPAHEFGIAKLGVKAGGQDSGVSFQANGVVMRNGSVFRTYDWVATGQ